MKHLTGLLIGLLIMISNSADALELVPVDEVQKDKTFQVYMEKLLTIVAKKDRKKLLETVAPDIENSFGGSGGKAEFEEQWFKGKGESPIWKELHFILTHGGSFERPDMFCAPYMFSKWPEQFDAFEYAAVITPSEPLYEKPSLSSKKTGTLKYTMVKMIENDWTNKKKDDLVKVDTGTETGYVRMAALRSPIGYRACFEKRKGRWMMVALVAGD